MRRSFARNFALFRRAVCFSAFIFSLLAAVSFADEPVKTAAEEMATETAFDFGAEPVRYIENDRLKVGFDLSIGGAVVYLEDKKYETGNMINSFDWGRQIQLSYYSGPNPFVGPNGEQPAPEWAGLGWNPIQSGDCGGNKSKVLEFKKIDDSTAFVRTRPQLWPHKGVPAECVFECLYRLTANGFELNATIINNRSDKTQFTGRSQETPALYTNAPWYKLVTYLGDKPFENEPTSVLVDQRDGKGWPWVHYYSPERWSALLDENDRGIGVYQPGATRTSGGFAGGDGNKGASLGAKDSPTGYIAPIEQTILDWNARYSYRATFIVGSLDEIRATANELAKADLPKIPSWTFAKDRQNWIYGGTTDAGFPISDSLKINVVAAGCYAASPDYFWRSEDAPILEIDAAFESDADASAPTALSLKIEPVSPADSLDYLSWSEGDKDRDKERAEKAKTHPTLAPIIVPVPVDWDGERRTIRVNLSQIDAYKGAMKKVVIDFPKRDGQARFYRVGFVGKN
jgi:hypothetical protein